MSETQSLMLQEAGQSPEVVATLLEKEKPVLPRSLGCFRPLPQAW